MNICKLIVISSLLRSFSGIPIRTQHNRAFNLYMKKSKNNFSAMYTPKSENQKKYFEYLNDETSKIIFSIGPAGTGKTLFACQKAITELKSEEINKIIITRPVVTVEEEIGFLPGNIMKKMDPWTKPIFDIFLEHFSKQEFDLLLYSNKIEICPLGFMRGRTFKNAFIIADEMQNSSPNQMKMLTTRLGENSKLVITGDLKQTDIQTENGLNDVITKYKKYNSNNNSSKLINIVEFANNDIERSEIVKKMIDIYDYKENKINETKIDETKYNETKINEKEKNVNDKDCALIPKQHMSTHFEVFSIDRKY